MLFEGLHLNPLHHQKFIKVLALFGLLLLSIGHCHAQEEKRNYPLDTAFNIEFTAFEWDESAFDIAALFSGQYDDLFKAPSTLGRAHPGNLFYIKLDFSPYLDLLDESERWHLRPGSSEGSAVIFSEQGKPATREFGFLAPLGPDKPTIIFHQVPFAKVELIDGHKLYIRFKKQAGRRDMRSMRIFLASNENAKQLEQRYVVLTFKGRITAYVFTGLALIVLLFALTTYFYERKPEYLFYSFYLLSLLAYFGRRAFGLHDKLFGHQPIYEYIIHMELQVLINLCYVLFARHFLNTPTQYKVLDRFIRVIYQALLIFILVDVVMILTDQFSIHLIMMDIQRYVMASFGVGGSIYLLFKAKSRLVYFIVFGSLAYTLGALGTLFLVNNDYMITGSAIEIFIFTLGLGYKSRQVLMTNAKIQQEILNVRMRALQAQMNPHFIFNALGSIQHLVKKSPEEALKYLAKFSLLLRQILESANHDTVLLVEEIDMLRNYIELESLRFSHNFTYEISVPDDLDVHNLEIPILLVQPYVENAIIHGLLPIKESAKLSISFEDRGNYFLCLVEDNGIGRTASQARKPAKSTHVSRGMALSAARIRTQGDTEAINPVTIEDLSDENGLASGTRVQINVPKSL